jgi:hypothetical protein
MNIFSAFVTICLIAQIYHACIYTIYTRTVSLSRNNLDIHAPRLIKNVSENLLFKLLPGHAKNATLLNQYINYRIYS